MTIAVNVEIGKTENIKFKDLLFEVYRAVLDCGRQIIQSYLEIQDQELAVARDKNRFRSKGFQKTCIKTILGAIEFERRVYVDTAVTEKTKCVHLLDEFLQIRKIGMYSEEICELAADTVLTATYREAAGQITKMTGLDISHQAVWNLAQRAGEKQLALTNRLSELAQKGKGLGTIDANLVYEENDGIWLKLQGKDRREHGKSKEMKVGIAYEGAIWNRPKNPTRRTLVNKVCYASMENAAMFRTHKEGVVANRFNTEAINLRVINGDGATWVQRSSGKQEKIVVLDEFHRNRKITECISDPDFASLVRKCLFKDKDIETVLKIIEAQANSVVDPNEVEKLKELYRYFAENKSSLLGYYDRNIDIPDTRIPGVIHHARLGSMESNVYTLIGNRMKDNRCCWSIRGANHLAALLCRNNSVGYSDLFEPLPEIPEEEVWVDTGKPLSGKYAAKKFAGDPGYYKHGGESALCRYISSIDINMLHW